MVHSSNAPVLFAQSPMAENIGISFVSGACVAALLKMVARAAAIAFGLAFVSIQGLAMAGVLSVDWVTVEKRMQAFGDLNKDGEWKEMARVVWTASSSTWLCLTPGMFVADHPDCSTLRCRKA